VGPKKASWVKKARQYSCRTIGSPASPSLSRRA
jgi:hypothetical protein